MITLKNNELYYYNVKIKKNKASFLLIPSSIFIIFYLDNYIKYFHNVFLFFFIAGTYDGYLSAKKYNLDSILYFTFISHIIGLYPFINIKKYMKQNIYNYLFTLLAIIITIIYPYWPYLMSKKITIIIIIAISIFTTLLDYLYNHFF